MVPKECKFSYSELDDSLIVSCREENENVKQRFSLGNFIFNLTGRGKIVGVQILNSSEVLSDYNLNPNLLNEIQEVNLLVAKKDDCLMIALIFTFQNQVGKISLPIMNLTANQIR